MRIRKLSDYLFLIDLQPAGFRNYIASYVVKGAQKIAIVETGPTCSVENLLAGLREIDIKTEDVDYVMVTHVHIDHAGGAGTLLQHLPKARLLVHSRGAPHIINPEKLWAQSKQVLGEIAEIYGEIQPVPENCVSTPSDGALIDLGGSVQIQVLETLGHASHHLAFYERKSQGVFQGDSAGIYVPQIGVTIPTTPAPFHLQLTLASLSKLRKLKPQRLYYTHFGSVENAVERLESYEAQLNLWAKKISEAVKRGDSLESMYTIILEQDPQMSMAVDLIEKNVALRQGVVMQSIYGFLEHFRKTLA